MGYPSRDREDELWNGLRKALLSTSLLPNERFITWNERLFLSRFQFLYKGVLGLGSSSQLPRAALPAGSSHGAQAGLKLTLGLRPLSINRHVPSIMPNLILSLKKVHDNSLTCT